MTNRDKELSNHDHDLYKNDARLDGALDQLRNHQRQLDPDGVEVGVSREAIDVVLSHVASFTVSGDDGALIKDVTRFLVHPDCKVCHGSDPADLTIDAVDVVDGVLVCRTITGDGVEGEYPLAELWPAGVASDWMREVVKALAASMTEDLVATLIEQGVLKRPDPSDLPARKVDKTPHPDWRSGGPVEQVHGGPTSETVHHLGAHPEYVADKGSTSTVPTTEFDGVLSRGQAERMGRHSQRTSFPNQQDREDDGAPYCGV